MKPKTVITGVLTVFVIGSLAYMGAQEVAARRSPSDTIEAPAGVEPDYIVYYFSMGKDCTTCENIDAYTREALKSHFADAVASGSIQWRTADLDKPEHEHFRTEYNLYTKSIVLVDEAGGRWENLTKVWDHVYDKRAFIAYIRGSLEAFMEPAT